MNAMTAQQFARMSAFMEYPIEDAIGELGKEPFNLTAEEAGTLARNEYRAFQEREIGDEHAIALDQRHSGGAQNG